jgi:hypothetical protein
MLKYFDYIFYRIYVFYKNKKDPNPIMMTLNFIGVIQIVMLLVLVVFIQKFTSLSLSVIERRYYWVGIFVLGVGIYSLNAGRYMHKKYYLDLVKINASHPLNKKVKNWVIFIQPIILLLLMFLVLKIAN